MFRKISSFIKAGVFLDPHRAKWEAVSVLKLRDALFQVSKKNRLYFMNEIQVNDVNGNAADGIEINSFGGTLDNLPTFRYGSSIFGLLLKPENTEIPLPKRVFIVVQPTFSNSEKSFSRKAREIVTDFVKLYGDSSLRYIMSVNDAVGVGSGYLEYSESDWLEQWNDQYEACLRNKYMEHGFCDDSWFPGMYEQEPRYLIRP
ncbi:hypothetical protein N9N16_02740 [Porticoccaceae bacterium]|nr:hypothetical protein [Porticoccaceae bacterium]